MLPFLSLGRKDPDSTNYFRQSPVDAGKFSHHMFRIYGKVSFGHGGLRSLEDLRTCVKPEAERLLAMIELAES